MLLAAAAPETGTTTAVLFALGSTLVLVALHLLAPRIRNLPLIPEEATASFSGGLAVAYVFLHLLPEIARGSQELSAVLDDHFEPTPLLELAIFAVALVGFLLFYGLERLAETATGRRAPVRHGEGPKIHRRPGPVFWVHVGSYMLYNGVIAYTLPTNWRINPWFALLFTLAIGLHFMLNDRALEEHYGEQFDRWPPRLLLAGALAAGWALGALFAPTRTLVVSVLIAFLAGGVLMNVFKEEVPAGRRSHFGWFAVGLVFYAALLALVIGTRDERAHERSAGPLAGAVVAAPPHRGAARPGAPAIDDPPTGGGSSTATDHDRRARRAAVAPAATSPTTRARRGCRANHRV